jgi:hypothetical protein
MLLGRLEDALSLHHHKPFPYFAPPLSSTSSSISRQDKPSAAKNVLRTPQNNFFYPEPTKELSSLIVKIYGIHDSDKQPPDRAHGADIGKSRRYRIDHAHEPDTPLTR